MKALIRNEKETVTEDMGIEGIDWTTGAPLTNAAWCGGPYTLVTDYAAPAPVTPETYQVEQTPAVSGDETVTINGVTYTKTQLKALLGE